MRGAQFGKWRGNRVCGGRQLRTADQLGEPANQGEVAPRQLPGRIVDPALNVAAMGVEPVVKDRKYAASVVANHQSEPPVHILPLCSVKLATGLQQQGVEIGTTPRRI